MSEGLKPANGAQSDLPPPAPAPKAVPLSEVPSMNDDEVLDFTRRIRIRHITTTLENNQGLMPADLDEQKVLLAALKDLDSQAGRNKLIGAKEKGSAVDREVAQAVMRLAAVMGDQPLRREPIAGAPVKPIPSISDANLDPISLVPDETRVGVDTRNYDEFSQS